MSSENIVTLSDVCRAASSSQDPKGVWADTFDCVVNRAQAGDGRKPSKADVYDPANGTQAKLAWFGGNLQQYEGKVIRIGGKGNRAKLYSGATEISVGKNGTINVMGDGQRQAPPSTPAGGGNAPAGGNNPPPPPRDDQPKVDPVTYFHREMSKQALGYLHCLQYTLDVQERHEFEMSPEQLQACASSLFIEGNKRGLFNRVPKLRDVDDKGNPIRHVPPQPDPAAEEKARLAREEAERKRKEAEEALRRASHPQENLDEDVPF